MSGTDNAAPASSVALRAATPKGARQEQAILDATLVCLGRDGYAAVSLQRIAAEAGVQKRLVGYYFGDRQALLERAVRLLGDRLLTAIREAVVGLVEPQDIVAVGMDRVWSAFTGDRALLVAYLGLSAESVTDQALRATTGHINDGLRQIIRGLISDALARGLQVRMNEESLVVLIVAGLHGLVLEFVQRGDSPELQLALSDFRRWIASMARAPQDADSSRT